MGKNKLLLFAVAVFILPLSCAEKATVENHESVSTRGLPENYCSGCQQKISPDQDDYFHSLENEDYNVVLCPTGGSCGGAVVPGGNLCTTCFADLAACRCCISCYNGRLDNEGDCNNSECDLYVPRCKYCGSKGCDEVCREPCRYCGSKDCQNHACVCPYCYSSDCQGECYNMPDICDRCGGYANDCGGERCQRCGMIYCDYGPGRTWFGKQCPDCEN